MTLVSARPAALRWYAETLLPEDLRLREHAERLQGVLTSYSRRAGDFGADYTMLAAELAALSWPAAGLAREVHRIAAAFEEVDAVPWVGTPRSSEAPHGAQWLPASLFEQSYEHVVNRWDEVRNLGDLVVDLDQETWFRLLWGARRRPPCLGDYTGGGGLRGPDGRVYPLVIPELEIDGEIRHLTYDQDPRVDPATLGGVDDGWLVLDERAGVARVIDYQPGPLARTAVAASMAAGLSVPNMRWASPDMLARVVFGPDGRPLIEAMPRRQPHDPRITAHVETPTSTSTRRGRRSGALDLLAGAVEGTVLARQLHHPGTNVYRVLFEEHEDGSRRARMYTYQLATTEAGTAFVPFMGYVEGGQLRRRFVAEATTSNKYMYQGPIRDRARRSSGGSSIGPRTAPAPSRSRDR